MPLLDAGKPYRTLRFGVKTALHRRPEPL